MPALDDPKENSEIIIVSGLPRSGTSLMMRILVSAGIDALVDRRRIASRFNPYGYYEYSATQALKAGDGAWLEQAGGRAVKIVSPLLPYLPPENNYKIIFMERALPEVIASQARMLLDMHRPLSEDREQRLTDAFHQHLAQIDALAARQPNLQIERVSYNRLVANPDEVITDLAKFLSMPLDTHTLAAAVDPNLYHNRSNDPK